MPRPKGSKNKAKFMPRPFNRLEDSGSSVIEQLEFESMPELIVEPAKILQNEVINTAMEIKNVLRTINPGNVGEVENGSAMVKGLNVYFSEGWRLFATHYAGEEPGAGHRIIYILIRETSAGE